MGKKEIKDAQTDHNAEHLTSVLGAINARGGSPPLWEPRTATIDEKRAVVNLLREADYYPDAGTSPAAGNDGVVEDDWDRYQSRLASAGFMLVPAEAAPRDSDHPEAQQRCQTITNARTYGGEDTIVQCWFYHSHVGPHWFNDEAQGAAPLAEGLDEALDAAVERVYRDGPLRRHFDGGRVTLRGPWQFASGDKWQALIEPYNATGIAFDTDVEGIGQTPIEALNNAAHAFDESEQAARLSPSEGQK